MGVLDQIKEDWAVLRRAPMAFTGLLVAGLALGFSVGMMWSSRQIAIAEGMARMKEEELAALQRRVAQEKAFEEAFDQMKGVDSPKFFYLPEKPN